MDKVRCPSCGESHDLTDIELSFDRPSAYFDVPLIDVLDAAYVLAQAQQTGVYPEDGLEWVFPIVHPDTDGSRPAS